MTRTAATASARPAKCRHTGCRVYKPLLKMPNGRTQVLAQDGRYKHQGLTFPTRDEAVAYAERTLVTRREDVERRAAMREHSPSAQRYLQGEFTLWGGVGSLF